MSSKDLVRRSNGTNGRGTMVVRPGDPRAIIAACLASPLDLAIHSVEPDPEAFAMTEREAKLLDERGVVPQRTIGGRLGPGTNVIPFAAGQLEAHRCATPEQLVAIVVSLIASAPSAVEACIRVRAEVSTWLFQSADGKVR